MCESIISSDRDLAIFSKNGARAWVLKEYRSLGISESIAKHLMNVVVPRLGLEELFGKPTCAHVTMQKLCADFGFVETVFELCLVRANLYDRTKPASERMSTLLQFRCFKPKPHNVFLPRVYEDELRFLYSALEDERTLVPVAEERLEAVPSEVWMQIYDAAQVARIAIPRAGQDLASRLDELEQEALSRDVLVLQVWLKLDTATVVAAVDTLRSRGYFLGGILPRWFDTDGLLMQQLRCHPDFQSLALYTDHARSILQMVTKDWERACRQELRKTGGPAVGAPDAGHDSSGEMNMESALSSITVLDLSRLLPGPFCSMLLADLGADVIKVEDPKQGDYIRQWPPLIGKNSGFHVVLNRNKRSLTLNLKLPESRELFERLVSKADVVLESFRPGVMARLGLGYDLLKLVNPRLVYCSINGYGCEGKRSQEAGHDINYLARSGILSYSGRSGQPSLSGVQIADLGGGGLLAAFSIVAALLARERLGEGQFIDVPMMDGALSWNCLRWGKYLGDGKVPRPGDDLLNHGFACYNLYETRDGRHMSLGAIEPQFWKNFCEAAEQPHWNQPQYFEPGPHQQVLQQEIASFFKQKTLAEWADLFTGRDCCCEPIMNLAEVMNDPEMRARQMVVDMVHESWGAYQQLGIAAKFSLTPGTIRSHAPELGEHTHAILGELGLSPGEIEALAARGAI